jgi:hypothetical protein
MRRTLAALLAVALAALAAAAVAAGRSGSSSPCTESWTSAASGKPTLVGGTGHSGIFLWRALGYWYMSFGSGPSSGVGRISANTPVHVASATPTLKTTLAVTSNGMSFRIPAGGGFLTFRARCASRLNFSFAAAEQPLVFLGRTNRPVSPRFVLSRAQTTGVSGQIYLSGGCPIVKIGHQCPSAKPAWSAMQIDILTAATSKTGGTPSQLVKTIMSAADGSYSTTLAPGRYLLKSVGQRVPGGTAFTPIEVTVAPGVMTVADLSIDSGIR